MSENDPKLLFTLTPLEPYYEHPEHGSDGMTARAFINFRNIHLLAFGGSGGTVPSLKKLADENWLYFSSSSAAPADEDDASINNWERSPLAEVVLQVSNVPYGRQFLLKFNISSLGEHGRVRVAVDRQVTQTSPIHSEDDTTMSLLLPNLPTNRWVYVDIKHIATDDGESSALRFQSVSCYLV